jgi:hypothetical protein
LGVHSRAAAVAAVLEGTKRPRDKSREDFLPR